jgi:hypothetical protein
MTTESQSETKSQKWKRILVHELFEYFLNFIFLAAFLVAFAWYRRLILAEYNIQYLAYWGPVIEAAILAKVIMIGDALRMGRRFQNRALALTVIYRTIIFGLFVVAFSFAEHIIEAWCHGKTAMDALSEMMNQGRYEILARFIIMVVAFVPFFTMKEIERAFGAEKIRGMFLSRHRQQAVDQLGHGEADSAKRVPS